MAASIEGEYFVDEAFGAHTDWIVTFPTKAYYVDKTLYPMNSTEPFDEAFSTGFSSVSVGTTVCDREQDCWTTVAIPTLSYQVNTIPVRVSVFDEPSGVFGSHQTSLVIVPRGDAGNITVDFTDEAHKLATGHDSTGADVRLNGLPVVGFMAYNIVNQNAQQGVLSNYGGVYPIHATPACVGPAADCQ